MLVRGDLSPGMQLAQTAHGIAEFSRDHRDEFTKWIKGSNYICILQVDDEMDIMHHQDDVWRDGITHSLVYEPDIGEHTALVIAPSAYCSQLAQLPLAGREVATVS